MIMRLEKADNLTVYSFSGRWSDWVTELLCGNCQQMGVQIQKVTCWLATPARLSYSCLIWSENPEQIVTTVGLQDIIVVAMADAVLVVDKNQAQSITQIVDLLDHQKFVWPMSSHVSSGHGLV